MTEEDLFIGFDFPAAKIQLAKNIEQLYQGCTQSATEIAHNTGISPNTIRDIREGSKNVKLGNYFILLEFLAKNKMKSRSHVLVIIMLFLEALVP